VNSFQLKLNIGASDDGMSSFSPLNTFKKQELAGFI